MSFFSNATARNFGEIAACLLASKGRVSGAVDHAEIGKASPDVRRLIRSVGLLSEITASPFYTAESRAFLESMRPYSGFDQIAAMAHNVPMRRLAVAFAAAIESDGPDEGQAKSVSSFDIGSDPAAMLKSVALIIQSRELASALTETGINFLLDQLRSALGPVTDRRFFRAILDGVSAEPATGTDAQAFRHDVAAALKRLGLGQTSKPAIIVDPDQATDLSFAEDASGGLAFVDMSPSGGVISGTPVFVSSGVPLNDDVSPGTRQIVVLDCQGLAVDPGEVVLIPASQASVEIDSQQINLWERNLLGLLAERIFSASVVRAGSVSAISGTYGPSETSP